MDRHLFYREVYDIVKEIPEGRVVTYGQIAYLVGKPLCSRMVGQALFHVPEDLPLPCHRVVNSCGPVGSDVARTAFFIGSGRRFFQEKRLCRFEKEPLEYR